MALVAALPELAEVYIAYAVAADTFGAVKAVLFPRMAGITLQCLVVPEEWKTGGAMVKNFTFVPAMGLVAVSALFAQGLPVWILIPVAVEAITCCFTIGRVIEVAAFTANNGVFSL